MASFYTDPKTGKTRALIRRKGHKPTSKWFDRKRDAEAWAREVESALDRRQAAIVSATATVGQLIAEFRRIRLAAGRPVEPETNTHYMLEHLDEDLGVERVADLTPDRMVAWARHRREQGAGGYTVNMELSQLGTVLRHTASFLRLAIPDVVGSARPMLHYLQLISGGRRRTRRATDDELERLLAYLDERNRIVADAVRVAAITGMRRGELARITWDDVDARRRAVLVRQRKHPRRVEARDEWVPLLGEAWDVVQRQPRIAGEPRVFPVSRETLTDSVTAATRALGIPDLHLHDMRRNATSRLREIGFDQHERKAIVGHRSDEIHERYIAVTPESLHAKYEAAARAAAQDTRPRQPRQRTGRGRRP